MQRGRQLLVYSLCCKKKVPRKIFHLGAFMLWQARPLRNVCVSPTQAELFVMRSIFCRKILTNWSHIQGWSEGAGRGRRGRECVCDYLCLCDQTNNVIFNSTSRHLRERLATLHVLQTAQVYLLATCLCFVIIQCPAVGIRI